jgi:tRNA-2-methylthio-N6-dimethylallyladenosine synthase
MGIGKFLMKIHIKTYGCQMNERDSERIRSLLAIRGHIASDTEEGADVLIVNTCSVRAKAEEKAIGKLGLLTAKRRHPHVIVGAVGCMVQRMKDSIFDRVKGLDFALGTGGLSKICDILDRIEAGERRVIDIERHRETADTASAHEKSGLSAFVTVLEGCNRRCSYCIVPEVRGGEVSRPAQEILHEVRTLVAGGVREITLLGQSVLGYGKTTPVWESGHVSPRGFLEPFPRLLEALCEVEGLDRIRFTTSHPSGCTNELAAAISGLAQVCEHVHLPLQSGSDRILKLMNRGYTISEYRDAVGRLRERNSSMSVTTDLIVGFPSESDDEFEMTRRAVKEIGFDNAFVFKYSPRPGTRAEELADDVPSEEKLRRNHALLRDLDVRGTEVNAGLVGTEVEVLVEGPSLRDKRRMSGRTRTNKIVVFAEEEGIGIGSLVRVLVERAMPQTLYGSAVSGSLTRGGAGKTGGGLEL